MRRFAWILLLLIVAGCSRARAEKKNQLGEAYRTQGDTKEALAAFRAAIELDPDYAPAQRNTGIALLEAGYVTDGEAALERAIALDEQDTLALTKLGGYAIQTQNSDRAIELCAKAVQIDAADVSGYACLCAAYALAKDHPSTIANCEKATSLKKAVPPVVYSILGFAFESSDRKADAIEAYKDGIAAAPKFSEAPYIRLSELLWNSGKAVESIEVLKTAAATWPGSESQVVLDGYTRALAR